MKMNIKLTAVAASLALIAASSAATAGTTPYEVYAADQSNSVANAGYWSTDDDGNPIFVRARGIDGSFIWVWQGEDVEIQANGGANAVPVKYDMHDVFPGTLVETGTGTTLGALHASGENFGRLHGMLSDPQGMYMNINMFVTGAVAGGYVGIIDGETKEPVALFQVTKTGSGRSLHMSFWNNDGSALLLANLHGRILERINVNRDANGRIISAEYDLSASLNVGPSPTIVDSASGFNPAAGDMSLPSMVPSTVTGTYDDADLGLTTPSGAARQGVERPGNVIVCPIVSSKGNVYVTMGGGGLIVADGTSTPMKIIAEYDRNNVNGAGCGGIEKNGKIYLNAGASAAGSGATQSTMTVYQINDELIAEGRGGLNKPKAKVLLRDRTNTATIGATKGDASNMTGQLPGVTTRRDAHGMGISGKGRYIHQSDRIQNNVEVFNTENGKHVGTYSLANGVCAAAAADDVPMAYADDPAPDLMGLTPDGDFLVFATRGPAPVSVSHNAQGACPGVGIIKMTKGGESGELVTILRTTNTVDNAPQSAPGGYAYTGNERSDPHGASIRVRSEDM